jgi:hypothetical protein
MFSLLFYGFLAYLLYRLVFHFIIPIYRTTRQVKKSFRNMQEQMRQHSNPQDQKTGKGQPNRGATKVGDYIDFEEVKE